MDDICRFYVPLNTKKTLFLSGHNDQLTIVELRTNPENYRSICSAGIVVARIIPIIIPIIGFLVWDHAPCMMIGHRTGIPRCLLLLIRWYLPNTRCWLPWVIRRRRRWYGWFFKRSNLRTMQAGELRDF